MADRGLPKEVLAVLEAAREAVAWHEKQASNHITDVKLIRAVQRLDGGADA